jgi:ferredoxin
MLRKIIRIDDELCNGCGNCIPGCPEGALQMIDGKARLISDLFCDGLGACIGECPLGAITVEEREAEPYNEAKVMENIVRQGEGTIRAHLLHLKDHNETVFLREAVEFLRKRGIPVPDGYTGAPSVIHSTHAGCPGSMAREISHHREERAPAIRKNMESELTQWPIQLHLINPMAPYFNGSHLLVAADCVPFAYADFHDRFLRDRKLLILCPKLDSGMDVYIDKLQSLFSNGNIQSVTVLHMEVPCCFGVGKIIGEAMSRAGKDIPVTDYTITVGGDVKEDLAVPGAHAAR